MVSIAARDLADPVSCHCNRGANPWVTDLVSSSHSLGLVIGLLN